MSGYKFIDCCGSFEIKDPQHTSGLYLPVAGGKGLRSAVSPDFGGDSKLDQNHFLIAPKSISNLHADRDTRNFFCVMGDELWSACGASADQEAARFTDREDDVAYCQPDPLCEIRLSRQPVVEGDLALSNR